MKKNHKIEDSLTNKKCDSCGENLYNFDYYYEGDENYCEDCGDSLLTNILGQDDLYMPEDEYGGGWMHPDDWKNVFEKKPTPKKKDSSSNLKKIKKDAQNYKYTFPKLTDEDVEVLKDYDLRNISETDDETIVIGTLSNLNDFSEDWLGIKLIPNYLSIADSRKKVKDKKDDFDAEDLLYNEFDPPKPTIPTMKKIKKWDTYIMKKGKRVDAFKDYLHEKDILFNAMGDGNEIYFKVLDPDLEVTKKFHEILKTVKDSKTIYYISKRNVVPEETSTDVSEAKDMGDPNKDILDDYISKDLKTIGYKLHKDGSEIYDRDRDTNSYILKAKGLGEHGIKFFYYRLFPNTNIGDDNVISKKELQKKLLEKKLDKVKTCCICGKEYTGWGNNPWPIKHDGYCCDKCNETKVIPARLGLKNI